MAPEIASSGALYYVEKYLFSYFQKHLPFLLDVLGERRTNNCNRMTEKSRSYVTQSRSSLSLTRLFYYHYVSSKANRESPYRKGRFSGFLR